MRSKILTTFLLCLPVAAFAHTGHHADPGFGGGFLHPILGLDHLLAMIAVGLWAAQLGGRAIWLVPMCFVVVMSLGGLLGFAGLSAPVVEPMIAVSVFLLGLLIAAQAKLPLWAAAGLIGVFAIFHGWAHGAELPAQASAVVYSAGFLLSTLLLHAVGVGLGVLVGQLATPWVARSAGAAICIAGLVVLF